VDQECPYRTRLFCGLAAEDEVLASDEEEVPLSSKELSADEELCPNEFEKRLLVDNQLPEEA
jgi:hypothetical protein